MLERGGLSFDDVNVVFIPPTDVAVALANGTLDVLVDADEFASRREGFTPLPPRYTSGVLGKYVKLVGSAANGAICG